MHICFCNCIHTCYICIPNSSYLHTCKYQCINSKTAKSLKMCMHLRNYHVCMHIKLVMYAILISMYAFHSFIHFGTYVF